MSGTGRRGGEIVGGSGRKRVREGNGDAALHGMQMDGGDGTMRDPSVDEDDFIDVVMEQQDGFDDFEDEVESHSFRPPASAAPARVVMLPHVPFYPHLGGADLDDEYV